MLCRIEAFVGQRDERVDRTIRFLQRRAPQARGHGQSPPRRLHLDRGDRGAHVLGKRHRLIAGVSRQERAEFFPSQPGEYSARREQCGTDVGDTAEQDVADRMAVAVVDRLEVIEIEDDQGQRLTHFVPMRLFALHRLTEMATVRRPGQMIAGQQAADILGGLRASRDVTQHDRETGRLRGRAVGTRHHEPLAPIAIAVGPLLPAFLKMPAVASRDHQLLVEPKVAAARVGGQQVGKIASDRVRAGVAGLAGKAGIGRFDDTARRDRQRGIVVDAVQQGREPGIRLTQSFLLNHLLADIRQRRHQPVGPELDQRAGQDLGRHGAASAAEVDEDAMPVADPAGRRTEGRDDAAQFGRMLLQRREQIAGIARTGERHEVLHRVRVHQRDLAGGIALDQADRTGVQEFEELFLVRHLAHDCALTVRSGYSGAASLQSQASAGAPWSGAFAGSGHRE